MRRLGKLQFAGTLGAGAGRRSLSKANAEVNILGFDAASSGLSGAAAELSRQDPPMHPKDEFVFLLRAAAQIEHAFLIQYLYMAYSLPAKAPHRKWRRTLLQISKEEMGHLLSMQNLLISLGSPLCLGRDDEPYRSLFPFPFDLAPFSLRSIARFIIAEMPSPELIPAEIEFDLAQVLADAEIEVTLNDITRVGALFELLIELAAELTNEPDPSVQEFQARPSDWRAAINQLIVEQVGTLADFVPLLQRVSAQGEGSRSPNAGPPSHFERLHAIYLAARQHAIEHGAASLSLPVVENPTRTERSASGYIEHPDAARWADVLNHRYRWLLAMIAQSLATGDREADHKGILTRWAFEEMVLTIAPICELLTTLPRASLPGSSALAGAPFDMPVTTELPSRQIDRWRYQATLLEHAESQLAQFSSGMVGYDLAQQIALIDASRGAAISSGSN